ncbi:methylated-DNA--[protein]-cysteine S-methyltransferase [Facilibium subflavum]|uniref:methylated-DNA--[protein]-cysteine S-methyltransferase n=1 Tax=Facilibium subflavum TaxID=2219058 RepID=UPI000E6553A0|nr:methylated-DNA--[protein]-cysteine S-methyltransferase [Facilibium subflavum]
MARVYLNYHTPFDWQVLLAYYAKHKIGDLEHFDQACYRRLFIDHRGKLRQVIVSNEPSNNRLVAEINTTCPVLIDEVKRRLVNMFDLAHHPEHLQKTLDSTHICHSWPYFYGVRKIGAWDPFELVITTILGQLISIKQATNLTKTLIDHYGESIIDPHNQKEVFLFPKPSVLAQSTLDYLRVPAMKKIAIAAVSQAVWQKKINFSAKQDLIKFRKQLMMFKGIGRWSAEYIALRALGDQGAFPENDVFLQKILTRDQIEGAHPLCAYVASYCYIYAETIKTKTPVEQPLKINKKTKLHKKEDSMQTSGFEEVSYRTPFGLIKLHANDQYLLSCEWLNQSIQEVKPNNKVLKEAISQLDAYFAKRLKCFDLPIVLKGTTFQKSVWQTLQQIPFGQTLSYRALAEKIGNPNAVRAVGTANAKNPLCIIVPCHRVIKADGQIGGYAGGTVCKQKLLNLERPIV